jgi:hypothetical protein
MEPVVATSGNRWQTRPLSKRLKKAKTFAVVRDQLPFGAHGKEGVDASSPSEGFEFFARAGGDNDLSA